MNNNDKQEFAQTITGIGEVYDKSISKALMQIYFGALKDFTIEQVKHGFSQHILDSKHGSFFPKPADVARHVQTIPVSSKDKALIAWSQVMGEIRRTGSYGTLKLDDKQAMAAVRSLGSWQQLCGTLEKDMTWKKKEFLSVYETYENTPVDMLPSSMAGLIDLQNHKTDEKQSMNRLTDKLNNWRKDNE